MAIELQVNCKCARSGALSCAAAGVRAWCLSLCACVVRARAL
eukprot:CAMPEP_0171624370 /NCGR_PEP_ID=MMETSP0990-20121206/18573_1 /TAXON_ID=483369 /ORGANISM="non described non described, Strain CCMP2098" /LENGTH=41 /DNA_ID= /DNA_START= /DNA_END= /DNA_ORIENTATION=